MATKVKDPLHGEIHLDEDDTNIVDHPSFQRLRHIKQLGLAHYTYPGATHTRFEHSVGTGHVATKIVQELRQKAPIDAWGSELGEEEFASLQRTARVSGFLHDIGHTPFSHTLEPLLEPYEPNLISFLKDELDLSDPFSVGRQDSENHIRSGGMGELVSCRIILDSELGIRDLLKEQGVHPERVCACILGCVHDAETAPDHYAAVSSVISSDVDADKFDYLARDDLRTAADVVNFDRDRLFDSYTLTENHELALSGKAVSLIANLINGRTQTHMWIYQHHKVVYADALLRRCLEIIFREFADIDNHLSPRAVMEKGTDDHDMVRLIRRFESEDLVKPYAKRFRGRDFLKSPWKNALEYDAKVKNGGEEVRRNLGTFLVDAMEDPENVERKLADEMGMDTKEILVEVAAFSPFSTKKDLPVKVDGELRMALEDLGYQTPFQYRTPNPEAKGGSFDTVPYVFLPRGHHDECIDVLQRYLEI